MPTGDAYSSGHLVPSLWDLHMFYLLRPILFRTCRYFTGLCSSNIPRYFLDFAQYTVRLILTLTILFYSILQIFYSILFYFVFSFLYSILSCCTILYYALFCILFYNVFYSILFYLARYSILFCFLFCQFYHANSQILWIFSYIVNFYLLLTYMYIIK